MPLPDERPRQSVANLIGRFEQQQKRQPTPPGPPSRAASATSNNTGDAVKEEQRTAREWPPVKTNGTGSTPAAVTLCESASEPAQAPLASGDGAPPPSERTPVAESFARATPTVLGEEPINTHDNPAQASVPTPTPAPAPAPAPVSAPSIKPRTSVPTSRPSTAPPKRAKTPASPSKSTSTSSAAAPRGARPSITTSRATHSKTPTPRTPSKGTGTRSAPSTFPRTNATAKTHTPFSNVTPRPKTPSLKKATAAAVAGAGVDAGATGTPSVPVPRPSLPTSGLFAPTAASLAKARNAAPPPPPPSVPRKVDLSRLSKPTAASAGKVRSVASVVSPSPARGTMAKRGTGTPSRGAAAAAGAARGGTHTVPKKAASSVAATPGAAVTAAESDAAGDAEANGGIEGGDSTGLPHPGGIDEEQPSQEVEDDCDESAAHEEQTHEERDHSDAQLEGDDATAESDADLTRSQDLTAEDHPDAGEDVLSEQHATPGEEDAEPSVSETEAEAASEHDPEAASRATTEPKARLDEVKLRHPPIGDELEEVVKMLQGGPSFTSSTHLVVAGEIPDED